MFIRSEDVTWFRQCAYDLDLTAVVSFAWSRRGQGHTHVLLRRGKKRACWHDHERFIRMFLQRAPWIETELVGSTYYVKTIYTPDTFEHDYPATGDFVWVVGGVKYRFECDCEPSKSHTEAA